MGGAGGWGTDEISTEHLISSFSSSSTFSPPTLSASSFFLFSISLSEVSGDSGPPVIWPLPSFLLDGGGEERERQIERERLQPTTTVSPEAPLPACPSCRPRPLLLLSTSRGSAPAAPPEQLGSSPCHDQCEPALQRQSSSLPPSPPLHQFNSDSIRCCQTFSAGAENSLLSPLPPLTSP